MPAMMALLHGATRYDPPPYPPQLRHAGVAEPGGHRGALRAGHQVQTLTTWSSRPRARSGSMNRFDFLEDWAPAPPDTR